MVPGISGSEFTFCTNKAWFWNKWTCEDLQ